MRPVKPIVRAVISIALRPALIFTLGALASLAENASAVDGNDALQALRPVTDEVLAKPAPEDWLMRRGTYRAWGYSALSQITAQNVGRLKLAWAWNMEPGYQEEAPLDGAGRARRFLSGN